MAWHGMAWQLQLWLCGCAYGYGHGYGHINTTSYSYIFRHPVPAILKSMTFQRLLVYRYAAAKPDRDDDT